MRGGGLSLLGGLLLVTVLAAAPGKAAAARSCRIGASASADGSFAQAGYDSSPARLARLSALTSQRFFAEAMRLCAARVLTPADLGRFRRLIIQNGDGATEPLIYRTPDMPSGTYVFQFAFQDGDPPEPRAFEQALRCWKRPQSCDFGD
jgi:hypothetical protein